MDYTVFLPIAALILCVYVAVFAIAVALLDGTQAGRWLIDSYFAQFLLPAIMAIMAIVLAERIAR